MTEKQDRKQLPQNKINILCRRSLHSDFEGKFRSDQHSPNDFILFVFFFFSLLLIRIPCSVPHSRAWNFGFHPTVCRFATKNRYITQKKENYKQTKKSMCQRNPQINSNITNAKNRYRFFGLFQLRNQYQRENMVQPRLRRRWPIYFF